MDPVSTVTGATTLTTGTLVLIAIGMVCAVAIIWWGTMLRRRRAAAVAESELHAERAGHPIEEASAEEAAAPMTDADAIDQGNASGQDTPAAPPPEPAPIATAPAVVPEPQPAASPVAESPAPAARETVDLPLTTLKGLGPKAAAQLNALGIDRIDQLAALSADEAAALDARMGSFTGRMARDRWVDQAKLLTSGDRAGFEAAFGKLG